MSRTQKALYKDLSGWTKQLQVNADWVIPNVIADSFGHLANIDWGPMMCQALSGIREPALSQTNKNNDDDHAYQLDTTQIFHQAS